jgi:hypothetical protein
MVRTQEKAFFKFWLVGVPARVVPGWRRVSSTEILLDRITRLYKR